MVSHVPQVEERVRAEKEYAGIQDSAKGVCASG